MNDMYDNGRGEREFVSRPWFDVNWIKNDDGTRCCHLTTGSKFRNDLKAVLPKGSWPELVSCLDGNLGEFTGSQRSGTQVLQLTEESALRLADFVGDHYDNLNDQNQSIPVHLYALLEKLENKGHNHAKANKKFWQPRQQPQQQSYQPSQSYRPRRQQY